MTISAISSSSASFVSTIQKDRQAFNQLANALQSGDLTAAQSAYNTLASSPMAQGNSPFAQAIQQIGQDLQSGDASSLADAQKVMLSLQQARGHHHHHHGGGGEVSGSSNSSTASGTNPPNPDGDGDTDGISSIAQVGATDSDNKLDIKA
jgi:hypothetical protein